MKKLSTTTLALFLIFILANCSSKPFLTKPRMNTNFNQTEFDQGEKAAVLIKITAKNTHRKKEQEKEETIDNGQHNAFSSFAGSAFKIATKGFQQSAYPEIDYYDVYWLKKDTTINLAQSDWFNISLGKTSNVKYTKDLSQFGINGNTENADYQLLMIDPGNYTLNSFTIYNTYLVFNGNNHYTSPKDFKTEFASFEAKAGEVTYVGDLDIYYISPRLVGKEISVQDIKISVKDDEKSAKEFLKNNYPKLLKKLQKDLVSGH